ncbi:MAG: mannose-1-phosphate guanylyltransferase [Anaerolineae bacterium]|nr:mannose-1-phosphate guanylyltransferase [Anaerolineae bacterium]
MNEDYFAVIMAGGGGTRLWPLSRQSRPKQMLRLGSARTMFQLAIDRLEGLFPAGRILVVTVREQVEELQRQCPSIPAQNYLIEPLPRGTASVVGYAALALQRRNPDAIMAILTADHFIQDVQGFQQLLLGAYELAMAGKLVTLGIPPEYPATGYGYIERGNALGNYRDKPAFEVVKFKEKPSEDLATEFVRRGDHYWNSGMFIWQVGKIMMEFSRQMPDLFAQLDEIGRFWNSDARGEVIQRIWPTIKPQTIDYGIMENAEDVCVLQAEDLGWNDVGSWESLFDVIPPDEQGNIILGARHIGLGSTSTLVCSESGERLIATIGLRDLIIVDTGDVVLVCPRQDAQRVREMVNLLKQGGYSVYL